MTESVLSFHHHGLAVKAPAEAFNFLIGLGYKLNEAMFDPKQRVNLALCTHSSMPTVEVVWPGEEASPIDKILKNGPTLYHTCYATRDADGWIAERESQGVELITISPPTPAILFGGQKVSFHLISGFGVVELLHLNDAIL